MTSLSRPASAPDSSAGPARRRVPQLAGAGAAASALPAFAAYPDQTMALAPPAADVTTISIEPGVTPHARHAGPVHRVRPRPGRHARAAGQDDPGHLV